MAWAEFHEAFDLPVAVGQVVAYLPGMRVSLRRVHLDLAVAQERAREIRAPRREERDRLVADPYWRP